MYVHTYIYIYIYYIHIQKKDIYIYTPPASTVVCTSTAFEAEPWAARFRERLVSQNLGGLGFWGWGRGGGDVVPTKLLSSD